MEYKKPKWFMTKITDTIQLEEWIKEPTEKQLDNLKNIKDWKNYEGILSYDDFKLIATRFVPLTTYLPYYGIAYYGNEIFIVYTRQQAIKHIKDNEKDGAFKEEWLEKEYLSIKRPIYVDYFISSPLHISYDPTPGYVEHPEGRDF